MKTPARVLLIALLVGGPVAFAAPPPDPAPAPGAQAPGAKKISIEFRGNLRDALKKIATAGGLNLVVTGELSQDSEVYLRDVTAEEALRTVAEAYDLKLHQKGNIWTLRPMTKEEAAATPAPPAVPAAPDAPAAPEPPAQAAAPQPPSPPASQVIVPGMNTQALEAAMADAEKEAEAKEAQAEELRERADAEAERAREAALSQREAARLEAEKLRESAREARERAREARERAREVEQRAKAAIRAATRNIDRVEAVGTGAVEVKEGEVVDEAVAFGGPLRIFGHVQGDAVSLGGNVTLGPKSWVEGDVVALGGNVEREEGAVVDGEIQSLGGAVVGQAVREGIKEVRSRPRDHGREDASGVVTFLVWFMVLFGVGFVANLFVPGRLKAVQEEVRRKPVQSGLLGFLATLALLPLTVLLVITLIGIPLAILVLWPAAMLAAAIGFTVVASELGMRLPFFRGRKTQAIVLAVGLAVLILIGHIPVLGALVVFTVAMVGFGAIVATRFGGRADGRPTPMSPTDMPTGVPV